MKSTFVLKHELKRRLAEREMSAADLARRSGIARSVISDWLAGAVPRNLGQLRQVSQILGVNMEALCFGDSSASTPEDGEWVEGVFEGRIRKVAGR